MLLIIDNHDSFTFNLVEYFRQLGVSIEVRRNDQLTLHAIESMAPQYLVISPGPGHPRDAGISPQAITHFAGKLPILGVCLGHQAIGEAFGGTVTRAKEPRHGRISHVVNSGRGVFAGLPRAFDVVRYHSLIVDRASLPTCFEITAESEAGEIMGLRVNDPRGQFLGVEGVQFHPESLLTEHGLAMLERFLKG